MRPALSARALSRHATKLGVAVDTLIPFDFLVADDSHRSARVWAHDEPHARRIAAQQLRVDVTRLMTRPEPYHGQEGA